MSENNKDIIESAFSFSDIQDITPKEKQDGSKFIRIWQITQEEEIDKTQFEEEETEYEETPIAIQEEYETYGTENKQRLTKRTFYKKPNGFPEVAYFETFSYKEYERIVPPEGQISNVYIPSDPKNSDKGHKEIGLKYYDVEGNDLNNPYNFFLIFNEISNNYETYVSKSTLEQFSDLDPFTLKPNVPLIIQNIVQKVSKVRTDELGCGYEEKLGIFIANNINGIKDHCSIRLENNINLIEHVKNKVNYFNSYPFNELSSEQCYEKFLLDLDLSEEEKSRNFVVIPIGLNRHVSTMIIDLKNKKLELFDSSLYHDKETFGNFDVGKLNRNNLQMYGTCSYWMIGVCSILQEYENVDIIKKDCDSGLFQLKVTNKICQMFEKSPKPTIKYPFNNEDADKDNYSKFRVTLDGNEYEFGVNKNYSSCKFINVSKFLETFGITDFSKYEQLRDFIFRISKTNQGTNSEKYFKIEELKEQYEDSLESFKSGKTKEKNNKKKRLLSEWRLLYYKKELLQNKVLLSNSSYSREISYIGKRISEIKDQINGIDKEIEVGNIEAKKEFNKTHNINDFINSIYNDENWNKKIEEKIKKLNDIETSSKTNCIEEKLKLFGETYPGLVIKYNDNILNILDDIVFARDDEVTSLYGIDKSEVDNIKQIYSKILNHEGKNFYLEIDESTKKTIKSYLGNNITILPLEREKVDVVDVFDKLTDKLDVISKNIKLKLDPDKIAINEEETTSNQKYDYSKELLKERFLVENQLKQEKSKSEMEKNQLEIKILDKKLSIIDYKIDMLSYASEDLNKYTSMLNNIKRTGDVKRLEEYYFNYHYSGKEDSPVKRDPLYNKSSSNIKECLIKNYQLIIDKIYDNCLKNEKESEELDILEKEQEIETIKIKLAKGDNSVSESLLENKKRELKEIKSSFKKRYGVANIDTTMSQRPKSYYESVYHDLRVNANKKLKKIDGFYCTNKENYIINVGDNDIFVKTKNSSIFRDIQEIKITINKNKGTDENYINGIISTIEKNGFNNLLERKIPIQLKRKGRNIYEKMEKFTAKSIDSKLLQNNRMIQII